MHLSLLLESHALFLLDNLTGFLSEIDQDLVFLLNVFFIVHNLLPQVVLEGYEVVRVSHEVLVDLATLARTADGKVLPEVTCVDCHLVVLMEFLGQRPYSVEWHIGLLMQPGCHVFNAPDLHQRRLRAYQIRDKKVKEQLRLFIPEEKVVEDLHPVIFGESLSEECAKKWPSVDLRCPAHVLEELSKARFLDFEQLFDWLQDSKGLSWVVLEPHLHPLANQRHDDFEDEKVIAWNEFDEGKDDCR